MRTLNLQLVRELREHRGQVLSIALVVAAGVLSVITMRAMYRSLAAARDTYYREYRFGHVFARLERAPDSGPAHRSNPRRCGAGNVCGTPGRNRR